MFDQPIETLLLGSLQNVIAVAGATRRFDKHVQPVRSAFLLNSSGPSDSWALGNVGLQISARHRIPAAFCYGSGSPDAVR